MRCKYSLILVWTLFGASVLCGAQEPGSALISDPTPNAGDSPLVRAAKVTIAARRRLSAHASVIDNTLLSTTGGHFAIANDNGIALPLVLWACGALIAPATNPPIDRDPRVQQQIERTKREQAVMREEADQPWSDEINEDQVTKRLTEIPGEIDRLQREQAPPPPSR